jgi:hypothetical protein
VQFKPDQIERAVRSGKDVTCVMYPKKAIEWCVLCPCPPAANCSVNNAVASPAALCCAVAPSAAFLVRAQLHQCSVAPTTSRGIPCRTLRAPWAARERVGHLMGSHGRLERPQPSNHARCDQLVDAIPVEYQTVLWLGCTACANS